MSVKDNGYPSNSCREILLQTTNVHLMLAREGKSGGHQSGQASLSAHY